MSEEVKVEEAVEAVAQPAEEHVAKKYPAKRAPKRKVCIFCVDNVKSIDYKDGAKLRRYVTEKGKILPRRQTGVCATHQRALTTAIKRARVMAILPFSAE